LSCTQHNQGTGPMIDWVLRRNFQSPPGRGKSLIQIT
jgi:hypothetical protein